MNKTWHLFIEVENGIPVKLSTMTDLTPTTCGSTRFIGPIGHLKKDSNLETWSRLIEVLNKGFEKNNEEDQETYLNSIKNEVTNNVH